MLCSRPHPGVLEEEFQMPGPGTRISRRVQWSWHQRDEARHFRPGGTYVFFSHTIKGQAYNMPMPAPAG